MRFRVGDSGLHHISIDDTHDAQAAITSVDIARIGSFCVLRVSIAISAVLLLSSLIPQTP